MADKTAICNLALVKLGEEEYITNIETETTPNARACRMVYDVCRDRLLRNYNWTFALRRQALTRLSDAPDSEEWSYQYVMPTVPGYVRILDVPDHASEEWEVENTVLLTNMSTVTLRYVSRETDSAKYPADFVNALACLIAYEVAAAVSETQSKKNAMYSELGAAVIEAQQSGAIEQSSKPYKTTWADRDVS